ncbi:hypothetical protein ACT3RN_00710 [Psychrobacter sp. AOP5-GZ1-6]|uniref:hypothetical protein n=1 Tax=Psychrobacter sp. AOP5-GZ1-6 TaxID=3457649 RepID=UPI00402B9990
MTIALPLTLTMCLWGWIVADYITDDVWESAQLIWENTPIITDRELADQLTTHFGEDAPKSHTSVGRRRRKEEWVKNNLVSPKKKSIKGNKKHAPSEQNKQNTTHQKAQKTKLVRSKTNKAQNDQKPRTNAPKNEVIKKITDNIVMSAKQRATMIIKHRKRWEKQGDIQDNVVSLSLSLLDDLEDIDADPETIQKKIAVINILANALDVTTRASKTISEVELPLCGITPEDFSQSDQDRRLGALEALGDIDGQEREARDRLKAELDDRLEWIKETASSGDFGRTPEPDDDDDIEEIDYTQVDD